MKGKIDRRRFLQTALVAATGLIAQGAAGCIPVSFEDVIGQAESSAPDDAAAPSNTLDPATVRKFVTPLPIPAAMPAAPEEGRDDADRYTVAARQFEQQILPLPLPKTTVWGYGAAGHPDSYRYPGPTIEARHEVPLRVQWINGLVDDDGSFLPHLLPVDQTLHWANPGGGTAGRDGRGRDQTSYTGPVPLVTHLHGGHSGPESDGHPEAWYLPDAGDIPPRYAKVGSTYDAFQAHAARAYGAQWRAGSATYLYPNDQAAATLWYHDHVLGITRLNVYAGLSGFYLLRGGPGDEVQRKHTGERAVLPGPAPRAGDPPGLDYYEIPILIQDRSFRADGSLFYPSGRASYEGLAPAQMQVPFAPQPACAGQPSDVPPIWTPDLYGNTIVANGVTWPYLEVEPRRYRLRLLNGSDSRTLILTTDAGIPFHQIGASGGYLPEPAEQAELLLAPAERADVIVDFSDIPAGTQIVLRNVGPDGPFRGGTPGTDFDPADPATTGQVMQFRVVPAKGPDPSTPVEDLALPAPSKTGAATRTRSVSLNVVRSEAVQVVEENESLVMDCDDRRARPLSPVSLLQGTLDEKGYGVPLAYHEPITERPLAGTTEVWEIHNFTLEAHPIHLHLVTFEVVNRESFDGTVREPEPSESGLKDTVIAYPSEITRIRAHFDRVGQYMWHCHMLGHEDNEMMRPFEVI
jgi:spore coat protein A